MKLKILFSVWIGSLVGMGFAFADNPCPDHFLVDLNAVNAHFLSAKNGINDDYMNEYNAFMDAVKQNPQVVNCVDQDLGETPLRYVFNSTYNLCPYLEAAKLLISLGADVNLEDPVLNQTPLYLAVEFYGYTYGTPDPIELKRDICSDDAPKGLFKEVIASLLKHGADKEYASPFGKSIREVAMESKVEFLLK